MAVVPLGLSAFKRRDAKTPEILLRNMLVEKDPTNLVDGWVRLQRPGLTSFATAGDGPIRAVFKQKGTFSGDFLVVSGGTLYRVNEDGEETSVGAIGGVRRCQIAATSSRALIANGDIAYSTDGTTITQVAMPDSVEVSSVTTIDGYFLIAQKDSQRIYFIPPGGTDPDPLDFFSAESAPDNLVGLERVGDEFWAFGESTVQPFSPTGDSDAPFAPIQGRVYEKGCASRDTIVKMDNTVFWVGADKTAYRAADVPVRISDNGIEEQLRKADASTLRAWGLTYNGHTIYCLTIGDNGTFYYDVSVPDWGQFTSQGRTIWRAHLGAQTDGSLIVAGDDLSGDLWLLDSDASNDDGEPMVRELIGGVSVIGAPVPCAVFSVFAATGWANLNPPGDAPNMQMRFSDDGGNIWSNWIDMPLGRRGEFAGEVAAWRLGQMKNPSKVFHLRMSEDCTWRVSYARVNEFAPR